MPVVLTRPRPDPQEISAPVDVNGRWRIVRGERELGSYGTEEMARSRWRALRESVVGHGAKLIRPDGTVAAE